MKEIIFAGFGGQGILTAGMVLTYIASQSDFNTVWMPSYGASMRGGKANCVVKYGSETIGSTMMEDADILVAMNEPALSYLSFCKKDTKVFVNLNSVSPGYQYDENVDYVKLDCVRIANEIGNPRGANLVMLGAVIKTCNLFDPSFAEKAMCQYFEGKGKGKFNAGNIKALAAGMAAAENGGK